MGTLLACSPSLSGGLLSTLLAQCSGLIHLGVCEHEQTAWAALDALRPDLLLLEHRQPAAPGATAASRRRRSQRIRITAPTFVLREQGLQATDRLATDQRGGNRKSRELNPSGPGPGDRCGIQRDTATRREEETLPLNRHPLIMEGRTRLILLASAGPLAIGDPWHDVAWMVLRNHSDWLELLKRIQILPCVAAASGRPGPAPLPDSARFSSLRPREQRVLALLAAGLMSKEIASSLGLTCHTVETYRKSISLKLGMSGAQLLRAAVLHQCLELQPPAGLSPSGRNRNRIRKLASRRLRLRQAVDTAVQQRVVPLARRSGSALPAQRPSS